MTLNYVFPHSRREPGRSHYQNTVAHWCRGLSNGWACQDGTDYDYQPDERHLGAAPAPTLYEPRAPLWQRPF